MSCVLLFVKQRIYKTAIYETEKEFEIKAMLDKINLRMVIFLMRKLIL